MTKLDVQGNRNLGDAPEGVAFPRALGGMNSLRDLLLHDCGLRAIPAFVGDLPSLERLTVDAEDNTQVGVQALDFLLEGCPRLREVRF